MLVGVDEIRRQKDAKYNVIINGHVRMYGVSRGMAESYIMKLNEELQKDAKIIPVTEDGKEILLG